MKKFLSVFVILTVLATLLVAGQVNVMADDFTSGLVAHYDFNEIKDGVVKDVSGNGHDGTYQNVTAATGDVDGAVEITGSADGSWYDNTEASRVLLPSEAFTSEDITIAILLKADFSDVDGNNCVVMTCGATWDVQNTFVNFWLNHDNNGGIGPHMAIQPEESVERSHLRTEDDMVEEDEWTWLVYTQTNGEGVFYLNGYEAASGDMDNSIADIIALGGGDMCIGTSCIFPGDDSFGGLVDEVLIYNRALTASEAKNINNAVQAPEETTAPSDEPETTPEATEEVPVATEDATETPEVTTAPTVKPAETVTPTEVPSVDDGSDDGSEDGSEGGSILPIIIVIVVVVLAAAGVGCYFFFKKKK